MSLEVSSKTSRRATNSSSPGSTKVCHPVFTFTIYLNYYIAANVGPWKKLAKRRGAVIKYWKASPTDKENPYSISLKVEELLPLISERTRLVAITACSNILGSIAPVKDIVAAVRKEAKTKGATKVEVSVDCVAYAPHRLIDVQDWDVDYCVFSYYKVCSEPLFIFKTHND